MRPDSVADSGPRVHAQWPPVGRLLAWALLFVLAGYAGRATIIDAAALSLVWPAAGVSALWLASAHGARQRGVDALVFSGCTFVVNLTTGASPALAGVFVVSNLLQVTVFVLVMRRLTPHLWGFGGREPLRRLRDLGALVFTATLACLVCATVGSIGLRLVTGSGSLTTVLVWWGRNTTGLLTIGVLGLLLVGAVLGREGSSSASVGRILRDELTPESLRHASEVVAISGMTALIMVVVFFADAVEPLAFLLLFTSVMAGVRFRPLGAAWHGFLTGAVAIAFTIHGDGPFAAVADVDERALLAQVFVSMAVVTSLVLAFSRAERDSAIAELGGTLTQLVAAERESADQATLLAAVLDHINEGIVVLAADGTVLVRNEAGRRLLGLQGPASAVVQPVDNYGLVHPDGQRVAEADMPYTRAFAGEEVLGEDFHVRSNTAADGVVVEIGASPMPGGAPDESPRVVIHFRDVTAIRQERDSLAAFAGVVAHDLSNPLTAVRGWAQMLGDALTEGDLDPSEGLAMVQRIQSSGALMSQFIDDLLSYTLSRDTRLTPRDVDLTSVAREVAAGRSDVAPIAPRVEVQEGLVVHADPLLTRQLVDNLIGNAVKYVAPGVRPVVSVCGRELDGWLHVTITDNGIGVPEEMRQRIFENFQRAHAEEYRGTGIGLAICRRVVLRHGGTIGVSPVEGGTGSRFEFTLPMGEQVGTPARVLTSTRA
jgi:signal transduction histidine kinase